MSRPLWRAIVVLVVLALAAGACGNSSDDDDATPTTEGGSDGSDSGGGEGDRDTFVSLSGVPGVTDDEIGYAVIGTRTGNPLGTCIFDCYLDGIEAYFAFRNDEGGIYGRDLVVSQELDDELAQNQARSLEVTSGSDSFGAFQATLLPLGWGDLDSAGVPTYTWGIHAADAANRSNIFPSTVIRCADCTGRAVPYAAQSVDATKIASLGYGNSENSKVCTNTVADSVELYSDETGQEVAYVKDDLAYSLPAGIGPEVTAMKEAGVDFISTCMDLNAMKTLAQELERQDMTDVTLYHPNTYDQAFVADAGALFDGDFVSVQFRPFEADPAGSALGDFLEWMDKEGKEPTELAMVGWINASLAFEGLLAAGPEFDREKVTAATNAMTEFTADGLIEPVDWTVAHTPYTQATRDSEDDAECTALVEVERGEFVTVASPETPWFCWDGPYEEWSEPEQMTFG